MSYSVASLDSRPDLAIQLVRREEGVRHHAVVVALDGTAVAERALPFAIDLARRWCAPLRLVHVRNPVDNGRENDVCLVDNRTSLAVHSRSGAYLESLAETLRSQKGMVVEPHAITGVSVVQTLRAICEGNVAALVMVRSERSVLSRFLWGSVTEGLIGRSPIPLLLVPANTNGHIDHVPEPKRMLVYVDGTQAVDQVLDAAVSVAPSDAICHLLRVLPLSSVYGSHVHGMSEGFDLRDQAWLQLTSARERLVRQRIACKSRVIFDGHRPASTIVSQANAVQADSIVLASRPKIWPRWLHGCVAEQVVRESNVPVFVVPAGTSGSEVSHSPIHDVRAN